MSNVELPKPILIEDLGMLYATETSKKKTRFGLYECGFCGTHFRTVMSQVNNGHTKSCGCYHRSQASKSGKDTKTKHGGAYTKLYNTWSNIKNRTTNENIKNYSIYGGRGITICEEWLTNFVAFRDWSIENGYVEEDKSLSIDRIDNEGNYSPDNCRWTTRTIQSRNQRIPKNNKSGYKGVCFHKASNTFIARICINNKRIHLGCFQTAVEAGIAYNNYIIENNLEGFILNDIPNEIEQVKTKEQNNG